MALAPTSRLHWAGTHDQALDYAAGTVVLQGGALYRARVLRPHGAAAPADDAAHWDTLASAPAGVPVLYGPYVVDYTDIPHDGDKKTLWTPQVGDVLLRLFADYRSVTQWDYGWLFVGQNVDGVATPVNIFAEAAAGFITKGGAADTGSLDSLIDAVRGNHIDATSSIVYASAEVFQSADPVQIQLAQTGGTDPGAGHVEIYALVARAVTP